MGVSAIFFLLKMIMVFRVNIIGKYNNKKDKSVNIKTRIAGKQLNSLPNFLGRRSNHYKILI